ncbi:MAG: NAD(P)-binding domain-containing protein [Candidatus Binatia bacterium]|nr:NAD(P)-binding domain-containing protein [Candidatus Binatia bacterium]
MAIRSRFVVWAAGEFQYPHTGGFPGAELCLHSSRVHSWRRLPGEEFVVIGGYESGLDAAITLCGFGKRARVLDTRAIWQHEHSDPSLTVSPYTYERLGAALRTKRLQLIANACVTAVQRTSSGYHVLSADGRRWRTRSRPILATGFKGSHHRIAHLFDWREDGYVQLSPEDESTRTPGLFLVGPGVRHGNIVFCFIYKFRQRFAVVARAIARRLQIDPTPLERYRARGMFLDDLSCCTEPCTC